MGGDGMVGSALAASGRFVPIVIGPVTGAHSVCVSLPVFELLQRMAGEESAGAAL